MQEGAARIPQEARAAAGMGENYYKHCDVDPNPGNSDANRPRPCRQPYVISDSLIRAKLSLFGKRLQLPLRCFDDASLMLLRKRTNHANDPHAVCQGPVEGRKERRILLCVDTVNKLIQRRRYHLERERPAVLSRHQQ